MKTKVHVLNSNIKFVIKLLIKYPKIITNTELWEATGDKPIISQIRMRKWRWISHSLRKGKILFKNEYFIGTPREPEGEEDRSKPGKGQFWRKPENAAAWSEVKSLAGNRVRRRCFTNTLCS